MYYAKNMLDSGVQALFIAPSGVRDSGLADRKPFRGSWPGGCGMGGRLTADPVSSVAAL